jgi:hypothetical protein
MQGCVLVFCHCCFLCWSVACCICIDCHSP